MNEPMDNPEVARHPEEVDLVAFADGLLGDLEANAIAEHVAICDVCTAALGDLDALDVPVLGIDVVVPADLSVLFQEPGGDPQQGELWRLEWEANAALALVLGVDGDVFTVAPVTFEEPTDPIATVVPVEASPVDAAMFVWHRLAQHVPLGVFLAPAGRLSAAYLKYEPTATTFGEDTALLMADLAMTMSALADAWTLVAEAAAPLETATALPDLLRSLVPSQIRAATGIPTAAITELRRGDRSATEEEAELLASYLGMPVDAVRGRVSVPMMLARAIERPVHRVHIQALAMADRLTEMMMRRTVAEGVMPLAARTTPATERDVAAWDELVRHYLDE